ncbi:MAG TPA: lipid A hydroxylase LpxO, partial [Janthinobacterium sp.]|nr:lipid A hydroxylase LpxO [Janthinobacterium sp.]
MGQYRRRYKAWNKTAYKLTKYGLIIVVAAAIIWL